MTDPRYIPPQQRTATPTGSKLGALATLFMGLLYGISPIDLISDFIPLLGWSDDVVVLILAVTFAIKLWRGRKAKKLARP